MSAERAAQITHEQFLAALSAVLDGLLIAVVVGLVFGSWVVAWCRVFRRNLQPQLIASDIQSQPPTSNPQPPTTP